MPKNMLKSFVCFCLITSICLVSFASPVLADPQQEFTDGAAKGAGETTGALVVAGTACVVEGLIQQIVLPGSIPACIVAIPWFAKLWKGAFAK